MILNFVVSVVDRDKSEKMIDIYKEQGMSLILTMLGKGTAIRQHLSLHDLVSKEKAIIASIADQKKTESLMDEAKDKMYIDIGAKNREEAEKYLAPGDFAAFVPNFTVTYPDGMPEGRIVSKAIDDRIGCAVMLNALRMFKAEGARPKCNVCFAFTVGEEGGIVGAASAAYRTRPQYAIILESTAVGDIADTPETERVAPLGKGGALSIADRSTIYDRPFVTELMTLAETNGISCQYKKYISGGNDSSRVQRAAEGVKVAALSCPTRYLHTWTTVASVSDYIAMNDLIYAYLTTK